VRELDVVTGRGEVVRCSRHSHAALFDAVLAGAGQCGIIVRARVSLVPVEDRAVIFNLFYDDLTTYLADQLLVMGDERFTYQEGQLAPRADGSGWRWMMEVGVYYSPPAVPDQDQLLAGLSDDRASAAVVDQTYLEWVHRVDPLVSILRDAGLWDQPKPWVSLFVPADRAEEFFAQVSAQLSPAHLGAGLATVVPFRTDTLHRPLFEVPRSPQAFQVTLLRFPFPGTDSTALLDQNRTFHDLAVGFGGKRYIIGAVPDMTADDWRRHYGHGWWRFKLLKHWFDPDGVLTPGQGIFPG
jgi:FAD/FMN-containing dehydrogenase